MWTLGGHVGGGDGRNNAAMQMRFHTVTAKDRVERYIALVLRIKAAYRIAKDKYGVEVGVDPKVGEGKGGEGRGGDIPPHRLPS